jgi:hypothetical protein
MEVQSRRDSELTTALDEIGVETRTGQQAFARSGDNSRGRSHEHQHDECKQGRRDRHVIAIAVGHPAVLADIFHELATATCKVLSLLLKHLSPFGIAACEELAN